MAGALSSLRCKGDERIRYRRERDVGVFLSCYPGVTTLPVPEGKHVGVGLLGVGHAHPPAGRALTLHYRRADGKVPLFA